MAIYYEEGGDMMIGDNILTAIGLFSTCGLMILALLSTYPAVKAYQKGRNFIKWYVFSILVLPVAFIACFIIKPRSPDVGG